MSSGITALYNRFVLGHPRYVLTFMVLILAFFSFHIKDFRLDASADSLLLEDDQDLMIFRDLIDRYKTKEFLFLTFTPDEDLFSTLSLSALKKLKQEISQLPEVDSVVTMLDVPLVKQVEGSLSDVADNYRTLESKDVNIAKAKQELMASPIYNQLVISLDGHTTALQINLKDHTDFRQLLKWKNDLLFKKNNSSLTEGEKNEYKVVQTKYEALKKQIDQANHENIEKIRQIMGHYQGYGSLHLGGVPMITDDMISYVKNDLIVFGIGVFLFLVIMLGVIFRRKRWIFLPLASCLYSGILMIGLLGFVGWQVTVISSNFISLMLINTMAMNIHLIVRYLQLRRDYPEYTQLELVRNTTEKMVWPCLYTALTTIMAFTSLVVSDIKPVIDFGWMMTIGLTVTFLTSFLLFPSILVQMQPTEVTHHADDSFKFTGVLARITERFGNQVFLVSVFLAVMGIYGMTRLQVENSFINYFKDDTEIYQGLKLIDQKLGGTTPMDILIHFPPEDEGIVESSDTSDDDDDFDFSFGLPEQNPEDYWFTPHKLEQIARVHEYLEGIDAIGKVLSLDSIMKVGEDLNKGKFDAFELAIVNKRMPENLKESMIEPYVSVADNEARINMRIIDSQKGLHRNELLHKIHDDLIDKAGLAPGTFQITGIMVLYNNMLQSLFSSQIQTLGVVMAGIAVMLLVLFRSVSLAVIGIIPNLLAAGIILGLMGLLGIPLDMMTITIASITLGIAVDNSIHYIYRFREELSHHKNDYLKTMHYCHAHIGNAVFYTAITIIIGFSILIFSNFIPTIYFGLFTALAMLIALLAALTLLPKLILFWRPFD